MCQDSTSPADRVVALFQHPLIPDVGPIHRFSARAGPGQPIEHLAAPKLPQDKPEIKLEILAHILSDNPFFAAYFAAYTVSLFR